MVNPITDIWSIFATIITFIFIGSAILGIVGLLIKNKKICFICLGLSGAIFILNICIFDTFGISLLDIYFFRQWMQISISIEVI
jgi:hypothetical protein